MNLIPALNNRNSIRLVLILLVALCSLSGCVAGDAPSPVTDTTATTAAATPKATRVTPSGATLTRVAEIASTATSELTLTPASWVCTYLAGPGDTDVYSFPGANTVGSIPEGTLVDLWRPPVLDGGVTWYEIQWNDQPAYMIVRDEKRLVGGCGFLTQTPTFVLHTPVIPEQVDYSLNVSGGIGTVYTFSQAIHSENNDASHTLAIHVDLPEGRGIESARWVDYSLECTGLDTDNLGWGWWLIAALSFGCNDSTQEPISAGRIHYLEIRTIPDAEPITYTLTIMISAYSP